MLNHLDYITKKIKSINDLKKGDTIAIPNDPSNGGRALILLHNKGVITLKDPKNLFATEFDIVKNPKKSNLNQLKLHNYQEFYLM